VWVDVVPGFEGKQLRSVAKGEVELDGEGTKDADAAAKEREQQQEEYAGLLAWMTERLSEQVKEVRLSARLTTSAACVVTDADAITPALENIYRAMGQEVPHVKRILEVNPKHPLIAGLNTARAASPDDPALGDTAELVHSLALLAEGGELADPARFVTLVTDRLERTL
jgi:molecular chaperone HtpG